MGTQAQADAVAAAQLAILGETIESAKKIVEEHRAEESHKKGRETWEARMIRLFTEEEKADLIKRLKAINAAHEAAGDVPDNSDLPEMPAGTGATIHAVMIPKGSKSGNTKPSRTPIRSIDPVVAKVVDELRSYAKLHPDATAVSTALDGILGYLIDGVLGSETLEGEGGLTIPLVEELAALFPDSPIPWRWLSKMCIDAGDHQAALGYAERGLQVEPSYPELVFNRALCLQELGSYEAAIRGFESYIELNPNNPWAYNNVGDAFRSLKLYDQAEKYLKQAIERDGSFGPAYYNLAMLYMDQGEWTKCVDYAHIAEKREPSNKDVQLALGDAYMGLGHPHLALPHLVAATLIDRDFVEAYETMSATYVDLAMYELSVAAAKEALKLNPRSWMALANLGYCHVKQGKSAEAIRYQVGALQCSPDPDAKYRLYWDLGWNYLQIDQYARALACTEAAIRMKENPDVALPLNKGLMLFALGRSGEAEAVYREAIGKARAQGNDKAIRDGLTEIKDFMSKKGIQADSQSPLFELLNGNFKEVGMLVDWTCPVCAYENASEFTEMGDRVPCERCWKIFEWKDVLSIAELFNIIASTPPPIERVEKNKKHPPEHSD